MGTVMGEAMVVETGFDAAEEVQTQGGAEPVVVIRRIEIGISVRPIPVWPRGRQCLRLIAIGSHALRIGHIVAPLKPNGRSRSVAGAHGGSRQQPGPCSDGRSRSGVARRGADRRPGSSPHRGSGYGAADRALV